MNEGWTIGRRIALGFAAMLAVTVAVAGISIWALRSVTTAKDQVIHVTSANLIDVTTLDFLVERRQRALTLVVEGADADALARLEASRRDTAATLASIRGRARQDRARDLCDRIARLVEEGDRIADRILAQRRADPADPAARRALEQEAGPNHAALADLVDELRDYQDGVLKQSTDESTATADDAVRLMWVLGALGAALAAGTALTLTRGLSRRLGEAIAQVHASAAELQTAAAQQAASSKEQAAATTEIGTTMSELLSTTRQVAESARHVARIADEASGSARRGQDTVATAEEAFDGVRRQIDQVVSHMLDLGRKSQQIGGIVELITELAEQTNILAINAGIESAGAGEVGRRFGVVAEEIRNLADRVGASTKEIRALVDEVRAAVNTTVMATEDGSKAVDLGARRFGDVTSSFRRIAEQVASTSDAAREIELSTQQQATAVEQVDGAITDIANSARETEATAGLTLQTSSQLTGLSQRLGRMIRREAA